MTPDGREERIDRILEFLANNQAQLSARQTELSDDLRRLETIAASQSAQIEAHTAQIEAHSGQIAELGRYVLNLAHIVERTDERLNAVIAMVERRFGDGERPPSSEQ